MWIHFDRMRIRIKAKSISNHLLKVKKKNYFQICPITLEISYSFRFRLEKYDFLRKKTPKICWINSDFSLILYLWIRTRIRNADPTGSGSTSLLQIHNEHGEKSGGVNTFSVIIQREFHRKFYILYTKSTKFLFI